MYMQTNRVIMKKILFFNVFLLTTSLFAEEQKSVVRFNGEYQAYVNMKNSSVSEENLAAVRKEIEEIAQEALTKMSNVAKKHVAILNIQNQQPIFAMNLVTITQEVA